MSTRAAIPQLPAAGQRVARAVVPCAVGCARFSAFFWRLVVRISERHPLHASSCGTHTDVVWNGVLEKVAITANCAGVCAREPEPDDGTVGVVHGVLWERVQLGDNVEADLGAPQSLRVDCERFFFDALGKDGGEELADVRDNAAGGVSELRHFARLLGRCEPTRCANALLRVLGACFIAAVLPSVCPAVAALRHGRARRGLRARSAEPQHA